MDSLKIDLGSRSYDILIEENLLSKIPGVLNEKYRGKQLILVSNDTVFPLHGERLKNDLEAVGFKVLEIIIPDGERYKSWDMAGNILNKLLENRINRDAVLLALGGGVIGDLAGFVASIYQRGISFYQIPTSLLAQVDSSVGGKVAVNNPLGKNMIGSFYQPQGVFVDLDTLKTLPDREWKSGLAEIIKYGMIWDKEFFDYIKENADLIKGKDLETCRYLIRRSCEIKSEIVEIDEKERGIRAYLNLGHSFGHAIEAITEYEYFRHGEAVAIGIKMAYEFALESGLIEESLANEVDAILEKLDMKYKLPKIPVDPFIAKFYLDKKNEDGKLVFILPAEMGKVEKVVDIKEVDLRHFLLNRNYCE